MIFRVWVTCFCFGIVVGGPMPEANPPQYTTTPPAYNPPRKVKDAAPIFLGPPVRAPPPYYTTTTPPYQQIPAPPTYNKDGGSGRANEGQQERSHSVHSSYIKEAPYNYDFDPAEGGHAEVEDFDVGQDEIDQYQPEEEDPYDNDNPPPPPPLSSYIEPSYGEEQVEAFQPHAVPRPLSYYESLPTSHYEPPAHYDPLPKYNPPSQYKPPSSQYDPPSQYDAPSQYKPPSSQYDPPSQYNPPSQYDPLPEYEPLPISGELISSDVLVEEEEAYYGETGTREIPPPTTFTESFDQIIQASDDYRESLTHPLRTLVGDASGRKGLVVCRLEKTKIVVTLAVKALLNAYSHWAKLGTTFEEEHCRRDAQKSVHEFSTYVHKVMQELHTMSSNDLELDTLFDKPWKYLNRLDNAVTQARAMFGEIVKPVESNYGASLHRYN